MYVKDEDGPVIAPDGQQVGVLRVEVERHDAAVGRDGELGVRRVLEGEDADQAARLRQGAGGVEGRLVMPQTREVKWGEMSAPASGTRSSRSPRQRDQCTVGSSIWPSPAAAWPSRR